VEVRFLGGLEVRVGGEVALLGGPQCRVVFALLAADAGRTVPTAVLIDELWPVDPPVGAVGTIQTYVAAIRRALDNERGRLGTREGGYVLDLEDDEVDAARFAQLIRQGHELVARDPPAARARLEAALCLWRGEPLVGLTERSSRLSTEAARVQELRLAAVEVLAEANLRLGRHTHVIADLQGVVAEHPFRERAFGLLLRGLSAAGRQREALTRYLDFRQRLVDELGVDPSTDLQQAHRDLLATPAPPRARSAPKEGDRPTVGRLPTFLTRMFGRHRELEAVADLLDGHRLVTITRGGEGLGRHAWRSRLPAGRSRHTPRGCASSILCRCVPATWLSGRPPARSASYWTRTGHTCMTRSSALLVTSGFWW
jgi:DNA-binding SARP family transcriptional activator